MAVDVNVPFLRRLVGNPDAYALQQDDGSYRPVRQPLTPAILRKHLDGDITVGTYILKGDQARTLVFDLDADDRDIVVQILDSLEGFGIPESACGVEFSGKKGWHVWVVLPRYHPAVELMRVGKAVTFDISQERMEVFPKQQSASDLGNLVKLPGGIHRVTGKRAEFERLPTVLSEDVWADTLAGVPEIRTVQFDGDFDNAFPCMDSIQEGVSEGGRNNALFHFCGMLRRAGLSESNIAVLADEVNAKFDPPMDVTEVAAVLRSSAGYGPACNLLPPTLHCGDKCIQVRYKLGLKPRKFMLKDAAVGDSVVVEVVDKRGNIIVLGHPDLLAAKGSMR